ncbi:serpin family protein [Ruminococcus flavefaciens]|uniref:Serine protease inhibitor n=1 Tax=Ruminococcus flavefaciens TaxID=1265 RepID=A0A1M7KFJ8_RUMFL|nr:serpin family protein [Ruminococcus flavefaciens]SHM64086.1 Serine protease inhibitor [Ruminococcus flavefaciens]
MGRLKRIKQAAAGIMGSALLFSFAGGILPVSTTVSAADIGGSVYYNEEMRMYEYEFIDAYIYDIKKFSDYMIIDLIPSTGGNWFNYEYHRQIAVPIHDYDNEYYGDSDPEHRLKPETRVNIRFASIREYDDLVNLFARNSGIFSLNYIISLKDPDEHIYGDINDDGVIDSFDVLTYKKYLAGNLSYQLSEAQFLNADIDMDTEITEDDFRQVMDFVLGSSKEFNGTSNIGSVRLDNTVNVKASEGVKTDESFAAAEMKFGVDLLKKCFDPEKGSKNLLLSPLSISSALAMTANGADGETREEMEKVLGSGLTLDEINEYMAYYVSQLPDEEKKKIYLANSIWFKDDPSLKVYDEFLETNKKFYNSEIYKSKFDKSIVKDVNSWVNKNTKGMIPSILREDNIKSDTAMMLLNTLYFEAEWEDPYLSTADGKFTDLDGVKHPIKELNSMESYYYDLGNADAFKKPYMGEDYSFVGILPHEDVDFESYISELDGKALAEGLKEYEDPSTVDLYVMIPKFKYNYDTSLKDILPKIGMKKAFDSRGADFSKINDLSVEGAEPLYIYDLLHKTKIEVTEKGTKAAATTAVIMGYGSAAPIEKKRVYINLDRPFVYMIVDKNNVPLFIGAATQLEEK